MYSANPDIRIDRTWTNLPGDVPAQIVFTSSTEAGFRFTHDRRKGIQGVTPTDLGVHEDFGSDDERVNPEIVSRMIKYAGTVHSWLFGGLVAIQIPAPTVGRPGEVTPLIIACMKRPDVELPIAD